MFGVIERCVFMLTGSLSFSLIFSISLPQTRLKNYSEDLFDFGVGEVDSNVKNWFIEMVSPEFYSHHLSALSPGTTQVVLLTLSLSSIDQSIPNKDTLQDHRSQQSLINAPDTSFACK